MKERRPGAAMLFRARSIRMQTFAAGKARARMCRSVPNMPLTHMRQRTRLRTLSRVQVAIDKTFPLDDAKAGHEYLEAGKSTGKVLYKIA